MSLDDRLRAATTSEVAFDVEGDIRDVRRRAARIRRRRAGLVASAVIVLAAFTASVWPTGSDDATVDTADTEDVWFLPASVPDGYELAWVDPPSVRPEEAGRTDRWAGTYAYGYQSSTVEFDTHIIVGADLDDPASVAADLGDGGSADTIDGRGVVRWRFNGSTVRMLVDLDGAVAHVIVHPRGPSFPDPPPLPTDEVIDGYASSIVHVDDSAWMAALSSGADVADRYGPLNGQVVIEGDGWQVLHGDFRAPFSVRYRAVWARIGQHLGSAVHAPLDSDFWTGDILEAEGVRLAWGLAPTTSRGVNLRPGDQVVTGKTVLSDGWRVWAMDVSQVDTFDARVEFLDATGIVVADGPISNRDPFDPDNLAVVPGGDPHDQAAEMADRLGCDSTSDARNGVDAAALQPIAALRCELGDTHLDIAVYASQQDVTDELRAAAVTICGHRAVGTNWIVVTDTAEGAERAAAALGGGALTFSGCAGG